MGGVLRVEAIPNVTGPIADGQAQAALTAWANDVAREGGQFAWQQLISFPMDKTGRARGAFQSELKLNVNGPVARIPGPMVTGVTWAPWLEGISQRNSSTGFRGYRLFRKTRKELESKVTEIGEKVLQKYLPQMGGE